MATLCLKEMGKFLWEGREKGGKKAWRPNHFLLYQIFFCIFLINFAMATLVLKEMGKFLWEGREKVCPVGCLTLVLLN